MPKPNLDRPAPEIVKHSKGSIWAGLGLTLMCHFVVQVSMLFLFFAIINDERGLFWAVTLPLRYVGLSQLVYMIPAIFISRRKGEIETFKGLIIGASITFLLNAACYGLVFMSRLNN